MIAKPPQEILSASIYYSYGSLGLHLFSINYKFVRSIAVSVEYPGEYLIRCYLYVSPSSKAINYLKEYPPFSNITAVLADKRSTVMDLE